jgi:serine/threonine-protein kinase RsbW
VERNTTRRVSYTLASTLESVNRAESIAADAAAQAGFNDDEQSNIAMAVREAAVNAVLHGNAYDPQKNVVLAYESTRDALVITIRDQGKGLDPETLPDPLAPENLMKGSGRGIFLIRAFMDEVKFRNTEPGTEITLIKHFGRSAANAKEEPQ